MLGLASRVTKETKAQSCISLTFGSICRLPPAAAHQKPSVRCSFSNLPDSHLGGGPSALASSFFPAPAIDPSPAIDLPPSSQAGALGFVLSKYTRSSGRPDNESFTLSNLVTHGRHFISRTTFKAPPTFTGLYFIVIFICLF